MASLRKTKKGNFVVCFRFGGQQYQRALKTTDFGAAKAAKAKVEHSIYQLTTGGLILPPGADAGDYLVGGEAAVARAESEPATKPVPPTLAELVDQYLKSQRGLKAECVDSIYRATLGGPGYGEGQQGGSAAVLAGGN